MKIIVDELPSNKSECLFSRPKTFNQRERCCGIHGCETKCYLDDNKECTHLIAMDLLKTK